jgi:acyl-CoA-dependent ceramide synthase
MFVCTWIYLRHYLNFRILWSTLTEFRTIGPFELNWETEQYKCLLSQIITFSLLASLQAVNLFWLFLILRIARDYVFTSGLQDERSEDEESGDEARQNGGRKMKEDGKVALNGEAMANGHSDTTIPAEKKDI